MTDSTKPTPASSPDTASRGPNRDEIRRRRAAARRNQPTTPQPAQPAAPSQATPQPPTATSTRNGNSTGPGNPITPDETAYLTTRDPALLEGWRRYRAYSAASGRQKRLYLMLRTWIIRMSLLASSLAAIVMIPMFLQNQEISSVIRVALIALPITVAGMMTFAGEFTPNSAWIIFRVAAQQILHETYLYRTKAGLYSKNDLTIRAKQQLFITRITQKVNDVTQSLTSEETATVEPVLLEYEDAEKVAEYANKPKRWGDGFSPISGTDYVETRIVSQRNWYISRLQTDYRKLRRARLSILVFAGAGSVIAGISVQLAFMVVITTAIVTAITTWMQLEMQGKTYGHYNLTANKLDAVLASWHILSDDEKEDPERVARLVENVEGILEDEELAWMQQAIQSQMLAQQSMERTLSNIAGKRQNTQQDDAMRTAYVYHDNTIMRALDESREALGLADNKFLVPGVDDDTASNKPTTT